MKSYLLQVILTYKDGINAEITKPHCVTCVAVNKCWFKNEEGKKPKPKSYTFQLISQIFEKFGLNALLGLYHPFCHCKELAISQPTPEQIKTLVLKGKIDWMKYDKMAIIESMGYEENDIDEVCQLLLKLAKESYCKGNYKIRQIDQYGCKITLYMDFPGKNEKQGRLYPLKTGWSIFPEGSIKNNTLIRGLID